MKVREVPAVPVLLRMRGPASEFPLIEFVSKYPPDETRTLFNTAFGAHQYRAGDTSSDPIPAGSYWLRATSFNRTYGAKAAVSINLKRPNIVDLQLGAMPVVDLDVTVPPGYEKRQVRVGFHDADDPGSSIIDLRTQLTSGAPTDPAKIRFPYPGRYWLVARTELCASAASAGEVDLLNQPLTVKVDQTITVHIRFEKTCASIRGHVTSKGAAVPRARLAILVSGSPKDPGDVYVATAGEMGEYYLTGLNAGTYRMWSWRPDDEELGAIGSLAEIARKAHRVQLKPGQLKSIDIRILKIKKRPVK